VAAAIKIACSFLKVMKGSFFFGSRCGVERPFSFLQISSFYYFAAVMRMWAQRGGAGGVKFWKLNYKKVGGAARGVEFILFFMAGGFQFRTQAPFFVLEAFLMRVLKKSGNKGCILVNALLCVCA
jgi:hypothetical protein